MTTYDDTPGAWAARDRDVHALAHQLAAAQTYEQRNSAAHQVLAYIALAADAGQNGRVLHWAALASPALAVAASTLRGD